MPKTPTGKRININVEMSWRGKRKKPTVNITYASENFSGLRKGIDDEKFAAGAKDLCEQLIAAGDLDG